jgi:hypothetical protein
MVKVVISKAICSQGFVSSFLLAMLSNRFVPLLFSDAKESTLLQVFLGPLALVSSVIFYIT